MQVTKLGMPCSIARSGMRDSVWDNQTSQFCKGQTQVLITTDIMARNSHLMQKVSHWYSHECSTTCQYEFSDMSLHAASLPTCRIWAHESINDCVVDTYSIPGHIVS